ncbi:hypothetical protein PSA7680_02931 [Pseudoruegeria aquimaris]|uniref:Uncharacterized protein n=1 Tax=Pseudoruegeria aquimaris TaxID=393663 RepID=A0A1Y5TAW3_9RHOB|nr:hypothetical protein [Pseudoruegeria aquimaris]SLN56206.1 hypothetical protein PSA7680_02931 [Pseudoruegeria aquimaris]
MTKPLQFALALTAALACAPAVSAQARQGPPKPAFDRIAADLGLSESAVSACFPKMERGGGQRPERPDLSAVESCLKRANPALGSDEIRAALERNKPEGAPRR